jgi:deoxyadenosine/deoxycytidine kinase
MEVHMTKKFVAVAGNIGVGKSTLVTQLSERLEWQPFYEPEAENPYLEDFYKDMHTWAFHSQIYFLTRRLRAHRNLVDFPTSAIQDRTVYEDAEIFACNLYRQGHIGERDYEAYRELYTVLSEFLPPPDLVIYLRASVATLYERIKSRRRGYELQIAPEYLEQLNELYEKWITNFNLCPVLTVPADDLNYVSNPSHITLIERKVLDKLMGKDEVVFTADEVGLG